MIAIAEALKVNKTVTNIDISGNEIEDSDDDEYEEPASKRRRTYEGCCSRCGRLGHVMESCYATTHRLEDTNTSLQR